MINDMKNLTWRNWKGCNCLHRKGLYQIVNGLKMADLDLLFKLSCPDAQAPFGQSVKKQGITPKLVVSFTLRFKQPVFKCTFLSHNNSLHQESQRGLLSGRGRGLIYVAIRVSLSLPKMVPYTKDHSNVQVTPAPKGPGTYAGSVAP